MGIFGAIGGAICSGISRACSTIDSVVSTVGKAVSGFAKTIILPFPKIELAIKAIEVIATIVSALAEALGFKEENEEVDELGAKAVQCDKKPEDFDSTEKYIEYLRNEVKLDEEKFNNMSESEKLACNAVGVSILTKGVEEKAGVSISPEFLLEIAKLKNNNIIDGKEILTYIDTFKSNGLTNMKDMSDYLKASLDEFKIEKVDSAVVDAIKKLNPNMSDDAIQEKVVDMKRSVREG